MARMIGADCKQCRREQTKLYLKGERCYTDKCSFLRRAGVLPGQKAHSKRHSKYSNYGLQLREKQKVKRLYGVLERQFRRYVHEAQRRRGITGEVLLQLLESRFDNVVYRMGLAQSRSQARQLIRHGHFRVNGKKVDIPSYLIKPGDIISVKEKSRDLKLFTQIKEKLAESSQNLPQWVEVDPGKLTGKFSRLPARDELAEPEINEQLIIEYYSR